MSKNHETIHAGELNYLNHLSSRQADLKTVAATHGPPSQRYKDLERDEQTARHSLAQARTTLGNRSPHIFLDNKLLFYISTIMLLVVEAIINKPLFDMILLQSGGVSLLAAMVVSIGLVAAAHFAGLFMRQIWSDFAEKIMLDRLLVGLFLLLLISAAVIAIMYSRAFFAETNILLNTIDAFGELTRTVFGGSLSDIFRMAFSTSESLIMGLVNFGALTIAFVVAFLSHDSDKEYDARYRKYNAARKAFDKHKAQYTSRLEKVHRKYAQRLKNAKDAFVAAGGNVGDLDADDFKADLEAAEGPTTSKLEETGSEANPVAYLAKHGAKRSSTQNKAENPW